MSRDEFVGLCQGLAKSHFYANPKCGYAALVQTPGNHNVGVTGADQLDEGSIQAIRHVRTGHTGHTKTISRLSLTFGGACSIVDVYQRLAGFHTKCQDIASMKIAGPRGFGLGPDDAVLYLACKLADATTLIQTLAKDDIIGPALEECSPRPLGLERLCTGVYGTDVPTLNMHQMAQLQVDGSSLGSAGWLMCSIAAYVAVHCTVDRGLPGDSDYVAMLREVCAGLGLQADKPTRLAS